MKIRTTTTIMFERVIYAEGSMLELADTQANDLIAQGVAAAAKPEKQQAVEAPEASNEPQRDVDISKMNRTQLEAVAKERGIENANEFETKAALIAAIGEKANA